MLEAALEYASHGYCVFPIAPGKKTPWISKEDGGKGCLDALIDYNQIEKWWRQRPYCNIGLATGVNSGLFVIDIDPSHGGEESIRELIRKGFTFPKTPMSKTPSGGFHLFYRHYDGAKNSTSKLAKGVDTRGSGGYVVAAPSIIYDRDGVIKGEYQWRGSIFDIEVTEAPLWLRDKLAEEKQVKIDYAPVKDAHGSLEHLARFLSNSAKGERNNRMFWAASRAAELVRTGRVTSSEAEAALIGAVVGNWQDLSRALKTLRNGLRRGGAL
jgi:hypothetical protein